MAHRFPTADEYKQEKTQESELIQQSELRGSQRRGTVIAAIRSPPAAPATAPSSPSGMALCAQSDPYIRFSNFATQSDLDDQYGLTSSGAEESYRVWRRTGYGAF